MPRAYYRIHALLHTMRLVQEHEDQLCTLMTEIKNAGDVSSDLQAELHDLLQEIPAGDLQSDLNAVRETLGIDAPPMRRTTRSAQSPRKATRPAKSTQTKANAKLKPKAGSKPKVKLRPKAKRKRAA